jgi:hypothetical protein
MFSHVFEKYWDYLPNLHEHPVFISELPYCQEQMTRFFRPFAQLDLSNFEPSPTAEANQSDLSIAPDTGRSRSLGNPQE